MRHLQKAIKETIKKVETARCARTLTIAEILYKVY